DRRRGDREADAGVVARLALDLRVDADHAALRVQQRAAGVAVVDSRVGLDRVADRELRLAGDRPVERAHDAARDRLLEAERAADGDDAVADLQVARAAYGEREELRGGRVDLDHGEVGGLVRADQVGAVGLAVPELDGDRRGAIDDVLVRDDVPVAVVDPAGAFGLGLAAAAAAERGLLAAAVGLDGDLDDAAVGLAVDLVDGQR